MTISENPTSIHFASPEISGFALYKWSQMIMLTRAWTSSCAFSACRLQTFRLLSERRGGVNMRLFFYSWAPGSRVVSFRLYLSLSSDRNHLRLSSRCFHFENSKQRLDEIFHGYQTWYSDYSGAKSRTPISFLIETPLMPSEKRETLVSEETCLISFTSLLVLREKKAVLLRSPKILLADHGTWEATVPTKTKGGEAS